MNDEAFNSREEAIDFGKDYEYLMAAYYGLLFSFDDEITDFKISTNNNDFGDFDDVVIECCFGNGEEHTFALQLKHVARPIAQIKLITNNKNFSLKKYSKEFQKARTNFKKSGSSRAPFENFHFILFSNPTLEQFENIEEEWQKLEPIANEKIFKSDILIRKNPNCVGKTLFSVSQSNEDYLYEFKSEKEDSTDAEFFKQFSFYTKQKSAKEMEALIAEIILKKFKNCDSSVVVSYLNYFNYWCRRDFGIFKLTKENVRLKLAEVILSQYIPEPNLEEMDYFLQENIDTFYKLYYLCDVVVIDVQSPKFIQMIWNIVLQQFKTLTKEWSTPLPGVYVSFLIKKLAIPVSAFSENFNELSLKKMYIMLWHTGLIPMVVKIDKNSLNREDILLAIELSGNKQSRKKYILIDEGNHFKPQSEWRIVKYLSDISLFDKVTYTNLIQSSLVSLQGRPFISLQELIKIDENAIKSASIKDVMLMLQKHFVIGKDCKRNFPKYYVNRLVPKILLHINAITELENDLFVVSDINDTNDITSTINSIDLEKYLLSEQFGSHRDYAPQEIKISAVKTGKNKRNISNNFFIVARTGCTKQQFQDICSMNHGKNCHHVRFVDEEKMEWLESRFSTAEIQKCRVHLKVFKPEEFVKDRDVFEYFNNIVNVICAKPGMGKSILMNFLMYNCPSNHWVIMVNLGEHANFFQQEHNVEEVLNYFLKIEYETAFSKTLVKTLLSKNQVVFLWDGFDEISTERVDFVIRTIKSLSHNQFPQWVAGRNNSKKFLEDTFNTIALTISEFSLQDQYNYVYNYLKEKYEDERKVQEIIDRVNKNISSTLSCGYLDYTGIPLQLHMVVEIYLRKDRDENLNLITLTDIYQEFIRGKFDNLFEKAEADSDNHHMQKIREEYSNSQLLLYENAAIQAAFDNEFLENLPLECEELFDELEEGADNLGLIVNIDVDKRPVFSHKTYEEFLAASWLARNYGDHIELVKVLFEQKYSNIRLMFDMLLARDSPLHLAVLYRNLDILKMYEADIASCKDKGGRSILHVACSWGQPHPVVKMGEKEIEESTNMNKQQIMQQGFIGSSTDFMQHEHLSKMVEDCSSGVVKAADNSVPPINTLVINAETIAKVDKENVTYKNIVKFLLSQKCNVFETDKLFKWNAFQYADRSFSLCALDLLLDYYNINISDLKNYNNIPTLLHYSAPFSYDNLLKLIP